MNKSKRLAVFLVYVLGLFGDISAFGAKPFQANIKTSNFRYLPRAVEIPPADPVISGLPCQKARHWSRVTTYTECNTSANKAAEPSLNAKTFLKTHAHALELRQDLSDLKVDKVKESLNKSVTHFQQTFSNLPVLNAFVLIQQSAGKRVTKINTSYINNPVVSGAANPVITRDSAENNALEGIRKLSGISSPAILGKPRSELSWSPIDGSAITLVWVVRTRTIKPRGNFYTLVDANTGKLLLQKDQIVFVSTGNGMVYNPNPIQTSDILNLVDNNDENSPILEQQRVSFSLPGLADGTNLLKGEFVDLASIKPITCPRLNGLCPDADDTSRSYSYTRNQAQFEQVVVYHAIDSVQRYLRDSLGFQDAQGNATIRNFPTMAIAHSTSLDQSFYEPDVYEDPVTFEVRGVLNYGDGGVDDAEDSDIVVHEFGHAIQNNQNPGCFPGDIYAPQVNEARAIGEGFGDYLAASYFANQGDPAYQSIDAACVGEWDSTAYSKNSPSCMRRVDGTKHYPDDLYPYILGVTEPDSHKDGEIWSAALWDIHAGRNLDNPNQGGLGGQKADQLIIDNHFSLDCSNGITMPQAALAMVDSATDVIDKEVIRTKFCNRGILVDSACIPDVSKNIVVSVQKDSVLAMGAPNRNEGASSELRLRSVSKKRNKVMSIVVGFDLTKIKATEVDTARLVMTVQDNPGGWGSKGRTVAVLPLKATSFEEGNGTVTNDGNGLGVTWNCNIDSNIGNDKKDCKKTWHGGETNPRTAIPFVHTNFLKTGDQVTWDVSEDLKDGAMAWIVKKGNQNSGDDEDSDGAGRRKKDSNRGEIVYYSKEGNSDMAPRLEITFK